MKNAYKIFNEFLNKNKAFDRFNKLKKISKSKSPIDYIVNNVIWPEKEIKYWSNLNDKWLKIVNAL